MKFRSVVLCEVVNRQTDRRTNKQRNKQKDRQTRIKHYLPGGGDNNSSRRTQRNHRSTKFKNISAVLLTPFKNNLGQLKCGGV